MPRTTKRAAKRQKPVPHKRGPPTIYATELAAELCARIAEGKTLTAVCGMRGMPSMTTAIRWLADLEDKTKDELRVMYRHACEVRAQRMADGIQAEARKAIGKDAAGVAAQRLVVDADKWLLARLQPHKYGDHIEMTHAGEVGVRFIINK